MLMQETAAVRVLYSQLQQPVYIPSVRYSSSSSVYLMYYVIAAAALDSRVHSYTLPWLGATLFTTAALTHTANDG